MHDELIPKPLGRARRPEHFQIIQELPTACLEKGCSLYGALYGVPYKFRGRQAMRRDGKYKTARSLFGACALNLTAAQTLSRSSVVPRSSQVQSSHYRMETVASGVSTRSQRGGCDPRAIGVQRPGLKDFCHSRATL